IWYSMISPPLLRSAQFLPCFVNLIHILRFSSRSELALGNAAALSPQGFLHAFYSPLDILCGSFYQEVLAVDLTPERDLPRQWLQGIQSHTEDLGIDRIQPHFYQIRQNIQDKT